MNDTHDGLPPDHVAPPPRPPDLKPTLRQRSEERIRQNADRHSAPTATLAPKDTQRTLHELHVHQIELEMQNEELLTAHQQADEARARYLDLFDSAPVGYVIVSKPGLFLEVNTTAATLLGTHRHLLVKQPVARFIHKDDQDIYYLHRRQLIDSAAPQNCELRLVKPNGTTVWSRLDSTLAQDADGQIVCRVMLSDITERKQAEQARQESEARYHGLFNNLVEGFCVIEMICDDHGRAFDYRFVEVNPAFELQTGLRDVQGQLISDLAPGHETYWLGIYGQVAMTGAPARVVHESKVLGRWYDVSAYRVGGGDSRKIAVLFNDITETIRAEAQMRQLHVAVAQEKDRLEVLINSISDEVWFTNTHREFILANPAALREFDLRELEQVDVLKLALSLEVYRGDGSPRPAEEAPPLRALAGEVIHSEDETIRTPNTGELRHRQISAAPVRDAEGQIIGSVSVVRDITEQKRAEHLLRRKHAELQAMNDDLATFNQVAVGRELRMIELKQEINTLCAAAGQAPRYPQESTGDPS